MEAKLCWVPDLQAMTTLSYNYIWSFWISIIYVLVASKLSVSILFEASHASFAMKTPGLLESFQAPANSNRLDESCQL